MIKFLLQQVDKLAFFGGQIFDELGILWCQDKNLDLDVHALFENQDVQLICLGIEDLVEDFQYLIMDMIALDGGAGKLLKGIGKNTDRLFQGNHDQNQGDKEVACVMEKSERSLDVY